MRGKGFWITIHRLAGIAWLMYFLLILNGEVPTFHGVTEAFQLQGSQGPLRSARGLNWILLISFSASYFLIFPTHAADRLSPRVGPMRQKLLRESA